MEKHKFKFQKLELPKRVNHPNEHLSNNEKIDRRLFMDYADAPKITALKKKRVPFVYIILLTAFFLGLIYYIYAWNTTLQSILKNTEVKSKVSETSINSQKFTNNQTNTTKILPKKPIYFNYYDSIVFLNDVKGAKVVVSKGFDEYIKKNKIIVKSDGYYYNVFCTDLFNNYAVGDSIP